MYKLAKKYGLLLLITLLSALSLTSCEELIDKQDYITGQWRVVEVVSTGDCPYRENDFWTFYNDGSFESVGVGNFHEIGYWQRRNNTLEIVFQPNYNVGIQAYINNYQGDYMYMVVNDYSYNMSYTLRFVRVY